MKRTTILVAILVANMTTIAGCNSESNSQESKTDKVEKIEDIATVKTNKDTNTSVEATVNDAWQTIVDLVINRDIATLTKSHTSFVDETSSEVWDMLGWNNGEYDAAFKKVDFDALKETTYDGYDCFVLEIGTENFIEGATYTSKTTFYMQNINDHIQFIGVKNITID